MLSIRHLFSLTPVISVFIFVCCRSENKKVSFDIASSAVQNHSDTVLKSKSGVWIYFSLHTFPGENIISDGNLFSISNPYVKHELTPPEIVLLDSVNAGELNAIDNTRPTTACFWPKHAVVFLNDSGMPDKWINVCFECNQSRCSPRNMSIADMNAWHLFFQRIGWPENGKYDDFFGRAKNDSVFRKTKGDFHF